MAIVNAQVEAVQKLYVAYFNRPADAAGLDYWTNVVANANGDTSAASAAFAASAEYKAAYANLSNAAVVDAVYKNLFGHSADAAGKAYWTDLLDKKAITIDSVVRDVAGGAQTTDAEAYENKVAGATAFTAALDTAAEAAGYTGDDANALAKDFITSITTDATLAAAVSPAALAASVSAAVIAGTPFTLESGFAALGAAQDAQAAFLKGLDLDDDADTPTLDTDVTAALTAANGDVGSLIGTDTAANNKAAYLAATPAVQAALLQDQISDNATALKTAQTDLAADQKEVAKVAGLSAAVAALQAASDNADAADDAQTDAAAAQAAAVSSFAVKAKIDPTTVVVDASNGTVKVGGVDYIVLNSDDKLVLKTGIKEADHAGITALLSAVTAEQAALTAKADAHTAEDQAQLNVSLLDHAATGATDTTELGDIVALLDTTTVGTIKGGVPTVDQIEAQLAVYHDAGDAKEGQLTTAISDFLAKQDATNDPLSVQALADAAAVKEASDAIDALNEKVAGVTEAKANADQLKALGDAITAAQDLFTAHDFLAPKALLATNVATAGSDLYTLPAAAVTSATLSSFGRLGDDALFIGTKYTLGADETKGDNAKLEVFFKQDGANTKIYVETAAYGSDQAAHAGEQTIILTGVNVADVHLNNGIITVG